jgi:hypothetical protein
LSREGFLRRGVTKEDLSEAGKVPVDSERFTIERMVGASVDEILFRRDVGIGSRSQ